MSYRTLPGKMVPLIRATYQNKFFLWNMFGNIGPLVFALFAVPYIYGNASREYVGFLTITWAAIGYTGLFDFGLSRALLYFAAASKFNRQTDLEGAIRKSVLFAIGISIAINLLLYLFSERLSQSLAVRGDDQLAAMFIISATLPIYLVSNMIRSSLEGLEMFKEANIFKFAAYVSLFLCPAVLIAIEDRSLSHVCVAYGAVRLACCLYALAKLLPRLAERRAPAAERVSIPIGKILGFGGWATVSSTISPLMVYGDRFALAYFNGASAMAIYALLQEFIGKTILLSSSYITSIQPKLGYLAEPEAMDLYRREHKNVILFSVIIYAGCLLVSPIFVAFWLDVTIAEVAFLAAAMSIGFMFNSIAQAPLAYLLARGHPRRIAHAHVVEALLYFPLLIVAARQHGVVGAAIVGVLRQIFDYGILSWQARRQTA
ncbi:oligosaccharide flippase family protein [Sphingomonas sp. Ag1]|uniref:oligosaccharide flippase family protein n=1 Tax=Sphingomonas sp. Ag1 TaxID=1642949 RepID=UPI000AFA3EFE|nr:oligosaccharide flippase family protein [Sphingomonas sp. Ag1]